MDDYISREAAVAKLNDVIKINDKRAADGMATFVDAVMAGCAEGFKQDILKVPAADVREAAEVDALVDKATRIINDFYTAMPYEVYCKILNAVEDIYSMNKKENLEQDPTCGSDMTPPSNGEK